MDSPRDMRSASCARKISANSRSSLVLLAKRASFEKMRPLILPDRTSSSISVVSGRPITDLPDTASRRYTFSTTHPFISAYIRPRASWCPGLSSSTCVSVETRTHNPTRLPLLSAFIHPPEKWYAVEKEQSFSHATPERFCRKTAKSAALACRASHPLSYAGCSGRRLRQWPCERTAHLPPRGGTRPARGTRR